MSAVDHDGRPAIVMVHGLGSSGSFWDNLRPSLDARFRVLTPDLPGHGPGATPPIPALAHPRELAGYLIARLRHDGVDQPHLVGLSLGGWVALEMAALGFGASVVALAPAGLWEPGARVRAERAQSMLRRALPFVKPLLPTLTANATVKRIGLRSLVVRPNRVSDQQFLAAAIALGQAKGYGVCDRVAVRYRFDAGTRVRVPTTVAFGDADRVLPPASSQNPALMPEGAAFSIVEDCGHAMSWDRPDQCLDLIAANVARVDLAPT